MTLMGPSRGPIRALITTSVSKETTARSTNTDDPHTHPPPLNNLINSSDEQTAIQMLDSDAASGAQPLTFPQQRPLVVGGRGRPQLLLMGITTPERDVGKNRALILLD